MHLLIFYLQLNNLILIVNLILMKVSIRRVYKHVSTIYFTTYITITSITTTNVSKLRHSYTYKTLSMNKVNNSLIHISFHKSTVIIIVS